MIMKVTKTNYEKAIQMLQNGVNDTMAKEIIKQFCPAFFGLKNNTKAVQEYGCTRCDMCWGNDNE